MTSDLSRIAAWLQPQDILLDVEARDRLHVFELAAAASARMHGVDPAPVHRALWRREQAGSTALGNGLAIPHACMAGIDRPCTLFLRTKDAIEFDAPDGKPVSELLFIMAPTDGAKDDHLQLLALVARLFSDGGFRQQLRASADAPSAADTFRSAIARTVASPQ